MVNNLIRIWILVIAISVIPSITFAVQATPNEVTTFASLFKIGNMNIAGNIIQKTKKKYGIKDITKERVNDVLAKKYHVSVEQLQRIQPVIINIGTLAPANTPWIEDTIETIIPILSWETRGVVNARIYAGGVMGEDAGILRMICLGELQRCGCTSEGFMDAAPDLAVLTLPLLFKDCKQIDCVLSGLRKYLDDIFTKHGYELVGLIQTGFFYIFIKTDRSTINQVMQQKVITSFVRVERTYYNELGINPIPIATPAVLSSLQTDTINVDIAPPVWILGVQAFLFLRYYLAPPIFYSPAAIFMYQQPKMLNGTTRDNDSR